MLTQVVWSRAPLLRPSLMHSAAHPAERWHRPEAGGEVQRAWHFVSPVSPGKKAGWFRSWDRHIPPLVAHMVLQGGAETAFPRALQLLQLQRPLQG